MRLAPPKALKAEWIEIPVDMNCKYYKKKNYVLVHAVLTETICAHVYTDWKRVIGITRRLSTGYVFGNKRSTETISIKTCVIHQYSWWQPSLTAAEPNTMFGNRAYKEKKKRGGLRSLKSNHSLQPSVTQRVCEFAPKMSEAIIYSCTPTNQTQYHVHS